MSNPAETYESYMVPVLFAPWASRLVETANPQSGERILDLGCGTGVVARHVASLPGWTGRIAGVDSNLNMLAVARESAKQKDLHIEWYEDYAEKLQFKDGSFDVLLCQFALMFFANQNVSLSEMQRVLTPGGRLLLSVWQELDRHPFYQKLHEAILHRLGISGLKDIFSLGDADKLHSHLTNAGFKNVKIEPVSMTSRFPSPDEFLAGEIDVDTAAIPSMQHLDTQAREKITMAIRDDMKEMLHEATKEDHVVIQFHAFIAHAER